MGLPDGRLTLQQVPLFSTCSDEQLDWLSEQSEEIRLSAGDLLYREGSPAEHFYVLLEGALQITKRVDEEETVLGSREPGGFSGEVPLLLGTPSLVTARALQDSVVLRLDKDAFQRMLAKCPTISTTILNVMAQRVQDVEALMRGREKMAALGKLSAGLAHELNNPAAAAHRAVTRTREQLQDAQFTALELGRQLPGRDDSARITELYRDALERAAGPAVLDPLARSDREDEIAQWLDDHEIPEGWKLASTLADAGLDVSWLDELGRRLDGPLLGDVLVWLESSLTVSRLLDEAERSTARISDLVKAVKAYTYMDQAALQEMDVHEGLENTLTILDHKLKGGVTVLREYDPGLPRICAYGSELNQVWTNLIDNAVDAMSGQGRLRIRTARENEHILVEIADDGPGIPTEIRSRIFDPFFTTKGVGQGSGLGLDIVYGIVVGRHHGDVRVLSEPGNTRFEVRLPLRPPPSQESSS